MYERENICIFERDIVWAVRWQRPECGCFLLCGFKPEKEFDKRDLFWAMKNCPEHEREIEVVLGTMKEMPPSDEEVGHLFSRLLEEQIVLGGKVV